MNVNTEKNIVRTNLSQYIDIGLYSNIPDKNSIIELLFNNDTDILCLIGPKGIGKSTMVSKILPIEFSENPLLSDFIYYYENYEENVNFKFILSAIKHFVTQSIGVKKFMSFFSNFDVYQKTMLLHLFNDFFTDMPSVSKKYNLSLKKFKDLPQDPIHIIKLQIDTLYQVCTVISKHSKYKFCISLDDIEFVKQQSLFSLVDTLSRINNFYFILTSETNEVKSIFDKPLSFIEISHLSGSQQTEFVMNTLNYPLNSAQHKNKVELLLKSLLGNNAQVTPSKLISLLLECSQENIVVKKDNEFFINESKLYTTKKLTKKSNSLLKNIVENLKSFDILILKYICISQTKLNFNNIVTLLTPYISEFSHKLNKKWEKRSLLSKTLHNQIASHNLSVLNKLHSVKDVASLEGICQKAIKRLSKLHGFEVRNGVLTVSTKLKKIIEKTRPLSPDTRKLLHYHLLRLKLSDRTEKYSHIFEKLKSLNFDFIQTTNIADFEAIIQHYLILSETITEPSNKLQLARAVYCAGELSKYSNFSLAARYIENAIECLPQDPWHYSFDITLCINSAHALFLFNEGKAKEAADLLGNICKQIILLLKENLVKILHKKCSNDEKTLQKSSFFDKEINKFKANKLCQEDKLTNELAERSIIPHVKQDEYKAVLKSLESIDANEINANKIIKSLIKLVEIGANKKNTDQLIKFLIELVKIEIQMIKPLLTIQNFNGFAHISTCLLQHFESLSVLEEDHQYLSQINSELTISAMKMLIPVAFISGDRGEYSTYMRSLKTSLYSANSSLQSFPYATLLNLLFLAGINLELSTKMTEQGQYRILKKNIKKTCKKIQKNISVYSQDYSMSYVVMGIFLFPFAGYSFKRCQKLLSNALENAKVYSDFTAMAFSLGNLIVLREFKGIKLTKQKELLTKLFPPMFLRNFIDPSTEEKKAKQQNPSPRLFLQKFLSTAYDIITVYMNYTACLEKGEEDNIWQQPVLQLPKTTRAFIYFLQIKLAFKAENYKNVKVLYQEHIHELKCIQEYPAYPECLITCATSIVHETINKHRKLNNDDFTTIKHALLLDRINKSKTSIYLLPHLILKSYLFLGAKYSSSLKKFLNTNKITIFELQVIPTSFPNSPNKRATSISSFDSSMNVKTLAKKLSAFMSLKNLNQFEKALLCECIGKIYLIANKDHEKSIKYFKKIQNVFS